MKRIDWEYLRHKYVSGDDSVTLDYLSKLPSAPVLGSIKNRASKESWAEQRKTFRYHSMTKLADSATAQKAIEQTQKLVDAAEIITQHLQLSKALKSIAARRLREFDPTELSPRDLVAWITAATTIDRLAMGMSTSNVQMDINVDMSKLSDDQLTRLASGEDVAIVLNQNWQN